MKLKLPRVNKYGAMLAAAFVMAIIAVLLLHSYLGQKQAQYQQELAAQLSAGMVQVVVPVRNLAAGTVADGSNMATRLYPQDLIYTGTITQAKWGDYAGRTLARPVQSGKPLLESDFVAKPNNDFASTLPPNMRAVTIDVDTLNSIDGLVRPDDRVDVLLTGPFGPKSGEGGQRENELLPLFHLVKVMATGHRFFGEHADNAQANGGNGQPLERTLQQSYSTVTLEVTPRQASELILAQQVGTLRVVLSNLRSLPPPDQQVPRMSQEQLLAKLTGIAAGSGASGLGVQYIIGGSGGNGAPAQTYVPGPPVALPVPPNANAPAAAGGPPQQQALQALQQMIQHQAARRATPPPVVAH